MKISFLFHLLSFLPVHPPVLPQNHILVSEASIPNQEKNTFDFSVNHKVDTWIHFQSSKHGWKENEVSVYLPDFFRDNKNVPTTLYSSLYHYHLYQNHRFSKHLTYQDFCILEKQLSDIVSSYMLDDKHHYGIMMDEVFLQPEGITKYWNIRKTYNILLKQKYLDTYPDFVMIETIRDFDFM